MAGIAKDVYMELKTATIMTERQFLSDLQQFRRQVTSHLKLNLESPKRIQFLITDILAYLESIQFSESTNKRVESAKKWLKDAYENADEVSKNIKTDFSSSFDSAVKYDETNNTTWYQQVIGTAESALDCIIDYLTGNE